MREKREKTPGTTRRPQRSAKTETQGTTAPPPRQIREALPRGWALDDDGLHAHKDARLLFREAWILIVGLVVFGSVGLAFLWGAVPRGWSGAVRLLTLVAVVIVAGGVVAPLITRALNRR